MTQLEASAFLGTPKAGINMLSMIYMILFVPGTLLSAYTMYGSPPRP